MVSKNINLSGAKPKVFMSVAVLIFVVIAIYSWVVSPQTAYLNAAQDYERVAKTTEHKIDILTRSLNRKQGELAEQKGLCLKTTEQFFDMASGLQFLDNIEKLATNSGCAVKSLNYSSPETVELDGLSHAGQAVTSRKAEIELNGNYSDIAKFLKQLNAHSKEVSVSELEIATTDDFMAMTCNMNIAIYIIEDKELVNDVEK